MNACLAGGRHACITSHECELHTNPRIFTNTLHLIIYRYKKSFFRHHVYRFPTQSNLFNPPSFTVTDTLFLISPLPHALSLVSGIKGAVTTFTNSSEATTGCPRLGRCWICTSHYLATWKPLSTSASRAFAFSRSFLLSWCIIPISPISLMCLPVIRFNRFTFGRVKSSRRFLGLIYLLYLHWVLSFLSLSSCAA